MPDLRSELMKLNDLKFDDDVATESSPIIDTKPNMTKLIWEHLKRNPNQDSKQVASAVNAGDMSGISTRLKQMTNRGTVSRKLVNDTYIYQAEGDAYPELNRLEIIAKAQAARVQKRSKREKQREYNAKYKEKLKAEAPAIPPTSLLKNPNAEQLVNSMSVGMAKAVYLELKKVFEG